MSRAFSVISNLPRGRTGLTVDNVCGVMKKQKNSKVVSFTGGSVHIFARTQTPVLSCNTVKDAVTEGNIHFKN